MAHPKTIDPGRCPEIVRLFSRVTIQCDQRKSHTGFHYGRVMVEQMRGETTVEHTWEAG